MPSIFYSFNDLEKILTERDFSKVIVVSSEPVFSIATWATQRFQLLYPPGFNTITIPDGERAKEWSVLEVLLKELLLKGADRQSVLVALGGGTVGDLVGFAASIYKRGLPYINIPTTLLSQSDSCIGGKTGINFQGYKNQVGTFYNPEAIIIDKRFLATLSQEQFVNGLGEILKMGIIKDPSIFADLASHDIHSLQKNDDLEKLVRKANQGKLYFINNDPGDKGVRQVLNFGHTIGHAIEIAHSLGHGEAVLLGMLMELQIGESLGVTPPSVRKTLVQTIGNLGIQTKQKNVEIDWKAILQDKKQQRGEIMLPVVSKMGNARIEIIAVDKIISAFQNRF